MKLFIAAISIPFLATSFATISAHAQSKSFYECSGNYQGTSVLADVFEVRDSGHTYIKITEGYTERFFLIQDIRRGGGTTYRGTEVHPRTGAALGTSAELTVPRILMNAGSLNVGGARLSVRCQSASRRGGTFIN